MSFYRYAACNAHRVKCPAFTDDGRSLAGDELLIPFLYEHRDCVIVFCTDDVDDGLYDLCERFSPQERTRGQ